MPKIEFFWGDCWACRGIAFTEGSYTRNVHWIDLIGGRGITLKVRLFWIRESWSRLLTLGSK